MPRFYFALDDDLPLSGAAEELPNDTIASNVATLIAGECRAACSRGSGRSRHIGGFRRELGVVALAPRLAAGKINIVLAQEAPDILNTNVG